MGRCVHGVCPGHRAAARRPADSRCRVRHRDRGGAAVAASSHTGLARRRGPESGPRRRGAWRGAVAQHHGPASPPRTRAHCRSGTPPSILCSASRCCSTSPMWELPSASSRGSRARAAAWWRWSPTTAPDTSTVRSTAAPGRSKHPAAFSAALRANAATTPMAPSGPRLPTLFAGSGVELLDVQLFPVSRAQLGPPAKPFWDARRSAVNSALARAREAETQATRRRVSRPARSLRGRCGCGRPIVRRNPEHDAVRDRRSEARMTAHGRRGWR